MEAKKTCMLMTGNAAPSRLESPGTDDEIVVADLFASYYKWLNGELGGMPRSELLENEMTPWQRERLIEAMDGLDHISSLLVHSDGSEAVRSGKPHSRSPSIAASECESLFQYDEARRPRKKLIAGIGAKILARTRAAR